MPPENGNYSDLTWMVTAGHIVSCPSPLPLSFPETGCCLALAETVTGGRVQEEMPLWELGKPRGEVREVGNGCPWLRKFGNKRKHFFTVWDGVEYWIKKQCQHSPWANGNINLAHHKLYFLFKNTLECNITQKLQDLDSFRYRGKRY